MKSLLLTILLSFVTSQIFAVPADGVARNVSQPDGTLLTVLLVGDEHLHYYMTIDRLVICEGKESGFYYATYNGGSIRPSSILVHNEINRGRTENEYVADRRISGLDSLIVAELRKTHHGLIKADNSRRAKIRKNALGIPTTYIGEKKGLVILVEFPNQPMTSETAYTDYNKLFNEPGYTQNNHVGSVHDYFHDQSYGVFDLTFDIVGPVTVSRNYGYYGSDSMNGHNDMNVSEMITEACIIADDYIDYKDYDWDADGVVDQVFIIYAGYGQATGGASNTIWPHESYIADCLTLDGVTISQYACSNELYGSDDSERILMGIGTACHEFSHCLGLPDLYDTDYSGAFGMSYWGVMNSGSYNGPRGIGEVPCGYTAFERWFVGWLNFTDIDWSQRIIGIPSLEKGPIAYRILNQGNTNEYYTLENRQPDKWFRYVAQYEGMHGLLVTHIDYDLKAWVTNKVNPSPTHQRMSVIVADNSYGYSYDSFAGDLFPGSKNVTELTNASHINHGGRLFNRNIDGDYNMNYSILNMKEENGTVSFDVIRNDEIPTPLAIEAFNITKNSFIARWLPNGNADSYTLELEIVKTTKPFVSETICIDNVQVTDYLVTGLEAVYCNYRVRACKGELHTEWSNRIEVLLNDANAIGSQTTIITKSDPIYRIDGMMDFIPNKQKSIYIKNKQKFIHKKRSY